MRFKCNYATWNPINYLIFKPYQPFALNRGKSSWEKNEIDVSKLRHTIIILQPTAYKNKVNKKNYQRYLNFSKNLFVAEGYQMIC